MSTNNLRADAYAAGLTGLVDPCVAVRVLSGEPSWRGVASDVALTIACGVLALAPGTTRYLASLAVSMGVLCAVDTARSARAYVIERREYRDAVREVIDAYARLRETRRG